MKHLYQRLDDILIYETLLFFLFFYTQKLATLHELFTNARVSPLKRARLINERLRPFFSTTLNR